MKTKFKGLALTALLLSGSSMVAAEVGAQNVVGDIAGYGEEAYFNEEAAYAEENYDRDYGDQDQYAYDNEVAPVSHFDAAADSRNYNPRRRSTPARTASYEPVGASQLQQASFGGSACDAGGCDGGCGPMGCDGGCDSYGGGGGHCAAATGLMNLLDRCHGNTWATTDVLLWYVQSQDLGPLVTTANPGDLPVLGGPSTSTAFGDSIDGELTVGFRTDIGAWLSNNVGVGGRFWILSENEDSFSALSDGSDQSLGRSFFNTDAGIEDALLIALDGVFSGSVNAQHTFDIMAAEAYGRLRFGCSKNCQLDFIGGYSHFDIDESLYINSTTVNTIASGGNPIGTVRTFNDSLDIENSFNGGQIGFDMAFNRGRWSARSLTKVHLGNMNQHASVRGSNTRQVLGGPAPTTNAGGVLTSSSVTAERDVFAFAPEANFKLGYRFRPNVAFSVGYSFIYWDNVATAADGIDRRVSGNNIGTGIAGAFPDYGVGDSGLWAHGLDLGVIIDF